MKALLPILLFVSCAPFNPDRAPALRALNVFPHAATPEAIAEAVDFAIAEADILSYQETDDPSSAVEEYLAGRFAASGKPVYVGVNYSGAGHLDRCREIISLFQPTWFCYALEANQLSSAEQNALPSIYQTLKAENPELMIFLSIQFSIDYEQAEAVALVEHSDAWAVSIYPYLADGSFRFPPASNPPKPVIVSETGWPAEPFPHPETGVIVGGSAVAQAAYVNLLKGLPILWFSWYVPQDYDQMFEQLFAGTEQAAWARAWRDTGLLDGDGNARPALEAWRR